MVLPLLHRRFSRESEAPFSHYSRALYYEDLPPPLSSLRFSICIRFFFCIIFIPFSFSLY